MKLVKFDNFWPREAGTIAAQLFCFERHPIYCPFDLHFCLYDVSYGFISSFRCFDSGEHMVILKLVTFKLIKHFTT